MAVCVLVLRPFVTVVCGCSVYVVWRYVCALWRGSGVGDVRCTGWLAVCSLCWLLFGSQPVLLLLCETLLVSQSASQVYSATERRGRVVMSAVRVYYWQRVWRASAVASCEPAISYTQLSFV